MQREVFRKTAAGHAEVRGRALGLDARTRGLLILVNGELTVAELAARVGFDPDLALVKMVGAGLIDQVAVVPRARPFPPSAPAPAAPPPKPAPAPPPELLPADLAAARTRALTTLAPHYGPDALRMAAPLREAGNAEQFALALAALKDTLSVHMGRKLADRLSREIAHGP
ncbi:MAG TPA: hypothetical protein PKJ32_01960 [Piscinibacter sp.]|nr:hypothetical protein [Piscinibacter sp.]